MILSRDDQCHTCCRAAFHIGLLLSAALIFIASGIHPRDLVTWAPEVWPALRVGGILAVPYGRFHFTTLMRVLNWLFSVILIAGGHRTYSDMPLFDWLRDEFPRQRKCYARVGHAMRSAAPGTMARELLLRTSPLWPAKWLFTIVLALTLTVSAAHELLESATAVALGESADQFLGTQGDPWDSQWVMFLAMIGANTAQVCLSRLHDGAIASALRSPHAPMP